MKQVLRRRLTEQVAQGVVEYALVVAFVSVVIVGVLAASASGWITTITSEITDALSS